MQREGLASLAISETGKLQVHERDQLSHPVQSGSFVGHDPA